MKGVTRDTLSLPAGSPEGGSDPELLSAEWLGGDGPRRILQVGKHEHNTG